MPPVGVTVASNLPDGDALPKAAGSSSAQTSESRESVTFDMSETQREIAREPGAIRRISVAVLLNGIPEPDADGQLRLVPRPRGELEALDALVRSAVGFDEARGDTVTVTPWPSTKLSLRTLCAGFSGPARSGPGPTSADGRAGAVALLIAFGLIRPPALGRANRGAGASIYAPTDGLMSELGSGTLPEIPMKPARPVDAPPRSISTRCRLFRRSRCPTSTTRSARVR
jgi:flagellar M-ring protein FliF